MTRSPSVVAAATTLAQWAHERRREWSDLPLEIPRAFQTAPAASLDAVIARPSVADAVLAGLNACVASFERLAPLGQPAVDWLMRGAAVVSAMSVVMLGGINRGELFARWDRMSATVVAATRRAATPPAPPAARPAAGPRGTGRLTVTASNGMATVFIDGTPRGAAPVTVDLPDGAHHVLLRSPNGSVERAVKISAGESSEMTEAIFPGWIALATPVDLTMSEAGHALQRDERGWVILPPGPHDIHLDNRALGVHEVRHVVVTPGDTTRLSFTPRSSTISLTTNEAADVWIDGTPLGQAPLVGQPVAVGVHDIRIRSALHERWLRVRATVEPVQLDVDLAAGR